MKFLFFIVVVLVVIWFVGFIALSVLVRWLRRRTDEYNRAAKEAQRETKRAGRGRDEGSVRVEATRESFRKRVSNDVGDYVDFEEITEIYE
jgi:flagellar biosynthesis/type III secretory pathway M-ring protein FliF/YscJ